MRSPSFSRPSSSLLLKRARLVSGSNKGSFASGDASAGSPVVSDFYESAKATYSFTYISFDLCYRVCSALLSLGPVYIFFSLYARRARNKKKIRDISEPSCPSRNYRKRRTENKVFSYLPTSLG